MSIKAKLQKVLHKRERKSQLKNGAEVCDPRPLTLPTGIRVPPTQEQRFKQMMLNHQRQLAEEAAYVDETDFEDEEDLDMLTPFEKQAIVFDMEPVHEPLLPETETPEKTPLAAEKKLKDAEKSEDPTVSGISLPTDEPSEKTE